MESFGEGGRTCITARAYQKTGRFLDWSIGPLLTNLINDVVSSNVGYSTLSKDAIYTLAQCWRDLSMDLCREFLNNEYRVLESCWRRSIEG